MNNFNLDKEEIKNFKELTLNPGVVDAIIATVIQFFFILIISFIHPPIFNFISNNSILIIPFISLLILPILIILVIDFVNNYKRIKEKKNENEIRDLKLISAISFYTVPILFIIYFPSTILEFIFWIITAFGLYVGFGKDRFPLIKYSIELYQFPCNDLYFNKKVVRNIIPSVYCLNITLWIVLLVILLRIYPIPFLLIFYIKYIIQRKFFHDISSKDFYENWDKAERYMIKVFKIVSLIITIIAAIIIGLLISLK